MSGVRYISVAAVGVVIALVCRSTAAQAGPMPVGTSTTTLSYETNFGETLTASSDHDYSGVGLGDADILGSARNIRTFNSANNFGRRMFVANTGPQYADVLGPNESLISHAFFKLENGNPFFPTVVDNGILSVEISGIEFDQPVTVDPNTIMFHTLYLSQQVEQLGDPYVQLHNHFTSESTFRDMTDFEETNVFTNFPASNVVLDSDQFDVVVDGNGTNTLDITLTFEYDILRHLEETGQAPPPLLPAPQGFLEPFHYHLEYVVTPEPATFLLLIPGALAIVRRRRL